jgi:predicted transposase YbfD/YdcC
LEIRRHWIIDEPEFITYLDPTHKWANLRTIGLVEAERKVMESNSMERRYYISSLSGQAIEFVQVVRTHWEIENCVHWVLDVAFREDDCRVRKGNAPQNLAVLRHIALNLLRQEKTTKCGIKNKRLKAAWNNDYLLKVWSHLS